MDQLNISPSKLVNESVDKYCSTVFDLLNTQISNIKTVQGSIQNKIPRLNVQGPIDGTFLHILDEEPIS